jgi:hypothetical protein
MLSSGKEKMRRSPYLRAFVLPRWALFFQLIPPGNMFSAALARTAKPWSASWHCPPPLTGTPTGCPLAPLRPRCPWRPDLGNTLSLSVSIDKLAVPRRKHYSPTKGKPATNYQPPRLNSIATITTSLSYYCCLCLCAVSPKSPIGR